MRIWLVNWQTRKFASCFSDCLSGVQLLLCSLLPHVSLCPKWQFYQFKIKCTTQLDNRSDSMILPPYYVNPQSLIRGAVERFIWALPPRSDWWEICTLWWRRYQSTLIGSSMHCSCTACYSNCSLGHMETLSPIEAQTWSCVFLWGRGRGGGVTGEVMLKWKKHLLQFQLIHMVSHVLEVRLRSPHSTGSNVRGFVGFPVRTFRDFLTPSHIHPLGSKSVSDLEMWRTHILLAASSGSVSGGLAVLCVWGGGV